MARQNRPSQLQVEIVDPNEVSSLIQLEPSNQRIPRPSGSVRSTAEPPGRARIPTPAASVRVPPSSTSGSLRGDTKGLIAALNPDRVGYGPAPADPPEAARESRPRDLSPRDPSGARARVSASHPSADPKPAQRPPSGASRVVDDDLPDFDDAVPRSARAITQPTLAVSDERAAKGPVVGSQEYAGPALAAHSKLPPIFNERLVARQLAVSIHAAIQRSGRKAILLTSPTERSGKSALARLIAPEFRAIAPNEYLFVRHQDLAEYDPHDRPEHLVVIVDGPSMLDGDGLLVLPQRWMDAFEGAIMVIMGRSTRSDDLVDSLKWLDDAKIPTVGLVFNELFAPDPAIRVRRWWRWLRGGTVVRDVKRAILTGGRSIRRGA